MVSYATYEEEYQ